VLLALEVVVIALFTVSGFAHPAEGHVSVAVWAPSQLLVPDAVAGVVVFAVACFTGIETIQAWGEEATEYRALARAANAAVWCCGLGYALPAWAYITWIGPHHLEQAAKDPGQPLALLGGMFGPAIMYLATGLLLTSVLAAAVSFNSAIARYVLAMAREDVLPRRWATISRGAEGGAPLGGSAVQAVLAVLVVAGFLIGGADPMTMFTWLSAIGAVCVVLLLTAACWSAGTFFERGLGGDEPARLRQLAPFAGGVAGLLTAIFMSSNLSTLLATDPGSRLPWLVPAVIAGTALAAVTGGAWLRRRRPDVYAGISHGVPDQAVDGDDRLGAIQI
jgi:amino acid transporter